MIEWLTTPMKITPLVLFICLLIGMPIGEKLGNMFSVFMGWK